MSASAQDSDGGVTDPATTALQPQTSGVSVMVTTGLNCPVWELRQPPGLSLAGKDLPGMTPRHTEATESYVQPLAGMVVQFAAA